MSKKDVPMNRSLESVYKLAMDKGFRKIVREIRASLGIPNEGFGDEKEEKNALYLHSVLLSAIDILKQNRLDISFYAEMVHYIKFNRFEEQRSRSNISVEIAYPNEKSKGNNEKVYKKVKQPYVAVYILDGSSAKNVTSIIEKQWSQIEESIKSQGGNVKRIKTTNNKRRDYLVSLLSEKSVKQLKEILGPDNVDPGHSYKNKLISDIMMYEHDYKVSSRMVEKIRCKAKK